MKQNEKIDTNQLLILVIFFTIGTSILEAPSDMAEHAKQDAWISAIVGTGIGLGIIWLFTKIAFWFPSLTYVQVTEKVLGKWIGKIVSLLFIGMTFLYTAALLYQSGAFLKTHMMQTTPMVALNILMMLILIFGLYLGLETIARSAEILFFFFILIFITFTLLIAPEIKFYNVQPVFFEVGLKKIIQSSFFFVITSSVNAIVLLMVFPSFINKVKYASRSFIMGNFIGGLIIIITTFLSISILGASKTASEIYPTYELAKRINVADIIQRVEAFMAQIEIVSLFFKTILYFYATVIGLAHILNIKDHRPLLMPLGFLAVVISLILYPNAVYKQHVSTTTEFSLSLTVGLVIPLLLVCVYTFRKNKLKKSESTPIEKKSLPTK